MSMSVDSDKRMDEPSRAFQRKCARCCVCRTRVVCCVVHGVSCAVCCVPCAVCRVQAVCCEVCAVCCALCVVCCVLCVVCVVCCVACIVIVLYILEPSRVGAFTIFGGGKAKRVPHPIIIDRLHLTRTTGFKSIGFVR